MLTGNATAVSLPPSFVDSFFLYCPSIICKSRLKSRGWKEKVEKIGWGNQKPLSMNHYPVVPAGLLDAAMLDLSLGDNWRELLFQLFPSLGNN